MKTRTPHIIYFLGIGGIGMSALARYYAMQGAEIHGYDRTTSTLTKQLETEGIHIHYHESVNLIPENTELVIYTPAIPANNRELIYCQQKGLKMMKRSMVLGELTKNHFTIAVSGTHGKTSITSTIAYLLNESGYAFTAFIGGISNNFNSNIVCHKNSRLMLVEADEFDKSFLHIKPDLALVSSMDSDHLDIYQSHANMLETFNQFTAGIKNNGSLIRKFNLILHTDKNLITYGLDERADIHARNIKVEDGKYYFDLVVMDKIFPAIQMGIPGRHNIENALAALGVIVALGANYEKASQALATYAGVERRFDIHINKQDRVYIDDYAHHPEELKACIAAAREMYPNKYLTGIFQPHLYSRTRDLMNDFAESLAQLDELYLLDIYPAREEPIPGIDSLALFNRIKLNNKHLCNNNSIFDLLYEKPPQVLLTMGAGDIDKLVEPIRKMLETL